MELSAPDIAVRRMTPSNMEVAAITPEAFKAIPAERISGRSYG